MSLKLLVASLAVASAFKVDSAAKPALDNTLALRGGLSVETTSLLGALYNGGFGETLMANPDMYVHCSILPLHSRGTPVASACTCGCYSEHAQMPPHRPHHVPTRA